MGKLRVKRRLPVSAGAVCKPLQADYLPAVLGHGDYPGMVEAGHDVNTIAVERGADRLQLAAGHRIATGASPSFVDVFFPKLAELQKPPHHPKWRETNLAAALPGWTRFAGRRRMARREIARRNRRRRQRAISSISSWPASAPRVPISGADSSPEREQLFQQFLQWQARQHQ